jgi:uncharacterized protein
MRHIVVAAFATVALFAVTPARSQTPQTPQASPMPPAPPTLPAPPAENLAAARELVQVMRATDQIKAILPTILQNMKQTFVQNRPDFAKQYDVLVPVLIEGATPRLGELAALIAEIYARHFNVGELHELTAFYQTPTGQKFITEQPMIARESMLAGQQVGREITADLRGRMAEELLKSQSDNPK